MIRRVPIFLASLLLAGMASHSALAEAGYDDAGYGGYNNSRAAYNARGTADTYMETRVSDLEAQMRALNGKLEQAEWQNKKLQSQLDRLQGDLEMRLQTLEQRPQVMPHHSEIEDETAVALPRPRPARPPEEDAISRLSQGGDSGDEQNLEDALPTKPVAGRLGNLYMSGDKVVGADQQAVKPTLPKKPPGYGLTPQEQYDRAFGLLRSHEYDGAETEFKAFLEKNPKDKLADNAKYWLGETYYVRKQYDAAAVAFADAYQAAPKGAKSADSLLKLGLSLAGLKKTEDACTTLGEVLSRYPNAAASVKKRTQDEIKKLKCPT